MEELKSSFYKNNLTLKQNLNALSTKVLIPGHIPEYKIK